MPLLRLDQASLAYGTHVLLDQVDLQLFRGQKIGLLGRNGAGKSSLLKIINGTNTIDSGDYWVRPGTKIATLSQELPDADDKTVYEVVAEGLHPVGDLLAQFHRLTAQDDIDFDELAKVQAQIDSLDGWSVENRVSTVLSQLELNADSLMKELSGGWRRRVALGQALVVEPDILILDEPTNHLDIEAIKWLEEQLQNFRGAMLFVTHDREFLQQIANNIIELDRGSLIAWEGSYQGFLNHKEAELAAEERANDLFDKKLAQEEVWIRQGIKARRTRNEGRVRALKAMRDERMQRRERQGSATFSVEGADRSGKIVSELESVSLAYDGRTIIDNFSTVIMRGDKIGIIGANGAGKSTLIKLLLGKIQPNSGSVKLGTKIEVAYFDQLRESLDPTKNLVENVCEGRDFIEINGHKRHGISYLSDFLFSPERLRIPVGALSGGEQNRAILAKLFSKPANLLVLDEPTNDLDLETLELLEEILLNFEGTLLLVSHDRAFMNNVITSTISLDGSGKVREYVGGYDDWIRQGGTLSVAKQRPAKSAATKTPAETKPKAKPAKKLSYKVQRELEQLPGIIEALEAEIAELEGVVADPKFYDRDVAEQTELFEKISVVQAKLDEALERWMELDAD
ncbi:ATP-binding cassette domain-containing protein [uncultured Umboniibacter sp.]|uniref:ATP-binding cassette domain-containing protein n=1 Tax=uncultured Umboniibacter sp. TaxID=1798917 RepID=UPI00262BD3A0|nr:ATP-binding cassette domain-containing protein [uncultured Umboniibacter sp.]